MSCTTLAKRELTVTVKAGETRYVRFDVEPGFPVGAITPTPVWPDQGATEIQSLHYVGSNAD